MNIFRKFLFTNRYFEALFLMLQKLPSAHNFSFKLIASNHLYTKNTIRRVTRKNTQYELDISDYQQWLIYFNCNSDSSAPILSYLKETEVFIDAGANIGQTSFLVDNFLTQKGRKHTIYAFEPFPETFQKLETNHTLNPNNNVKIFHLGLGNTKAVLTMHKDAEGNSGGYRMNSDTRNLEVQKVNVTTIDAFVQENRLDKVDFIKIDVEGFEMQILEGALATIEKFKPKLYIEFCPENMLKQGRIGAEMLDLLQEVGYEIKDVNNNLEIKDLYTFDSTTDIICFNKNNLNLRENKF